MLRNPLLVALPTLLIGTLLGFGLAQLLGGPSESVIASAPGMAASTAPPSGAVRPNAQAASPLAGGLDSSRAPASIPVAERPVVSEREVNAAIGRVQSPSAAARTGAGTITGQALDGHGAPLAGVVVVAWGNETPKGEDPTEVGQQAPAEKPLEEYLRDKAREWAEQRANRQRATTDAQGGFTLNGLDPQRSYNLTAYLEGFEFSADGGSYSIATGSEVIFRARAIRQIPIELVYSDGTSPSEGVVTAESNGRTQRFAWTADAPYVRWPSGIVQIRGFGGLFPDPTQRNEVASSHASETVSVTVGAGSIETQRLVLEPRNGIRGHLVDPTNAASDRISARLVLVPQGRTFEESSLNRSDRATPVRAGAFAFLDLTPGTYAVGISGNNGKILMHETLEIGETLIQKDFVLPEPNADSTLFVRALGPDGALQTNLSFDCRKQTENNTNGSNVAARVLPDGRYALELDDKFFDDWPPGTSASLIANSPEYGQQAVPLDRAQREVAITFADPARVRVVVEGYRDCPYVDRLSVAFRNASELANGNTIWLGGGRRGAGFNADGEVVKDGLSPGRWKVQLLLRSESWNQSTVEEREVDLGPGETLVVFALPKMYELVVIVPQGEKGGFLMLNSLNDDGDNPNSFGMRQTYRQLDESGRAVFDGLLAGRYRVSLNGSQDGKDVTVPCGDVYLETNPPDCFRVAISDLNGYLAKAGLQAGDLIVGADGEEFRDVMQRWNFLVGTGTVEVTVLRGNELLRFRMTRIQTNGQDLGQQMGGMLNPDHRP